MLLGEDTALGNLPATASLPEEPWPKLHSSVERTYPYREAPGVGLRAENGGYPTHKKIVIGFIIRYFCKDSGTLK